MTNVNAGDTARLVKPVYPENQGLICSVVHLIPKKASHGNEVWWYCEFDCFIKTSLGPLPVASVRDSQLRKENGLDESNDLLSTFTLRQKEGSF